MATLSVEQIAPDTVSIAGEVDGSTAAVLVEACDALGNNPSIECSRCEFIDSAGVSALVRIRTRVAADGGVVTLVDPSDAVTRVITITGLGDYFRVVDRRN